MIKKVVFVIVVVLLNVSCVSKKVYTELEDKYNHLKTQHETLMTDKEQLFLDKKELETKFAELQKSYQELKKAQERLSTEKISLEAKYKKLQESYDLLSSQSSEKMAQQAAKNRKLLEELEEKERAMYVESLRLEELQRELAVRSEKIDELEKLIAAKEAKMQQLKDAISNALHNFEGKGLTVEHKNGKVYVSMENKLLFGSGSWAVGKQGEKAVIELAKVLKENKDIDVLIEGHTDTVPYKGATLIDNWDLSVKRATAIVRILHKSGVSPKQITAAGRSEYVPVASNETTNGKAKNRRIEIILAPNLDKVTDLLND